MTDAPRTIWVQAPNKGGHMLASISVREDNPHRYHHDDVVQELRSALEECADELDAYYKAEYPLDHPLHERERNFFMSQNPARAALAKLDTQLPTA